jgi:Transcriptional regulator
VRQKDDKKEQQIFDATLELVVKSGLAGITICDISKAAGIATGTLYIYFKNKEELINELFTICRKESALFYFNGLQTADSFETSFRKIFYNIIEYRKQYFNKSIFLDQYYHSPYVSEKKRHEVSLQLQPFYEVMEKGKKQGLAKDYDNLLLLWYVVGCINEVIKGCHYRKKNVDEAKINKLYSMCWDGIKTPNP